MARKWKTSIDGEPPLLFFKELALSRNFCLTHFGGLVGCESSASRNGAVQAN